MWQGNPLTSFMIFSLIKKKNLKKKCKSKSKNCHVGKGDQELCLGVTILVAANSFSEFPTTLHQVISGHF
jgi:hypothetical protein